MDARTAGGAAKAIPGAHMGIDSATSAVVGEDGSEERSMRRRWIVWALVILGVLALLAYLIPRYLMIGDPGVS